MEFWIISSAIAYETPTFALKQRHATADDNIQASAQACSQAMSHLAKQISSASSNPWQSQTMGHNSRTSRLGTTDIRSSIYHFSAKVDEESMQFHTILFGANDINIPKESTPQKGFIAWRRLLSKYRWFWSYNSVIPYLYLYLPGTGRQAQGGLCCPGR